ncbi:MAG: 30S ribosomal protein S3 [Candidatus Geothermincolia bacterium]
MGQKVHPYGFRLGIITDWKSKWYSEKDYARLLQEDIRIRKYLNLRLRNAAISRIEIERTSQRVKVDIFTARPGIVIGRRGSEVDKVRADLEQLTGKQVHVNIQEIRQPELDAILVAKNIADQLVGRVSFRRAMKRAVQNTMRGGALGIRVSCSGRLGGAEMARREWYREGRVPLHTLRADIDYGMAEALTTFGRIGVKVWVYKGEIRKLERSFEAEEPKRQRTVLGGRTKRPEATPEQAEPAAMAVQGVVAPDLSLEALEATPAEQPVKVPEPQVAATAAEPAPVTEAAEETPEPEKKETEAETAAPEEES